MKHTITANGIQQGQTRGLARGRLHLGLAVGFIAVVCLTTFGGGIIIGMWYKANEHTAPLGAAVTSSPPEPPPQSREAASQPQEPVTFYNTLTNNNVAYAPLTPPPPPSGAAEGTKAVAATRPTKAAPAGATPAGATPAKATPAGATLAKATPAGATPAKATPAGATLAKATPAAGNESPKQTKAAVAAKVPPTAAPKPPESTKVAANKPVAHARQPERSPGAARPAQGVAVATARATGAEDFSVQVGSFGSAEQADRLRTTLEQKGYPVRVQPSAVAGQGLRYRVRVGNFADRTAADQTAHHLTAHEQVPAIVAGKD